MLIPPDRLKAFFRDLETQGLGTFSLVSQPGTNCLPVRISEQTTWYLQNFGANADMARMAAAALPHMVGYETEAQGMTDELSSLYEELTLMYRLAESFSGSLRFEDIQRAAITEIAESLEVKRVSLFLHEEETHGLRLIDGLGVAPEDIGRVRFPAGRGLAGKAFQEARPIIANDVTTFPEYEPGATSEKHLLLVPIPTKRGLAGVLVISDHIDGTEFTSRDQKLLSALAQQMGSAWENARLYSETRELFLNTIEALAAAIDAKDPYTHGHSRRVTSFSVATAEELGLSHRDVESIRISGLLHDIGKLGVSEAILRKPDRLTNEEFQEIKKHPPIGAEILGKVKNLARFIPGMVDHHEKYDGSGYPSRLKGEEISLAGRIIAVADTFDAMTSDRPYHQDRRGKPDDVALAELERCAGAHFDPQIVTAFLQAHRKGKIISQSREPAAVPSIA